MMKSIKVSELTGQELNWAVQKAEGLDGWLAPVNYCGNWEHGGPIIEREGISVWVFDDVTWKAENPFVGVDCVYEGDTPLIAVMRCYVASKLGYTIDVPEELF
jgi:hypothetical protein